MGRKINVKFVKKYANFDYFCSENGSSIFSKKSDLFDRFMLNYKNFIKFIRKSSIWGDPREAQNGPPGTPSETPLGPSDRPNVQKVRFLKKK